MLDLIGYMLTSVCVCTNSSNIVRSTFKTRQNKGSK